MDGYSLNSITVHLFAVWILVTTKAIAIIFVGHHDHDLESNDPFGAREVKKLHPLFGVRIHQRDHLIQIHHHRYLSKIENQLDWMHMACGAQHMFGPGRAFLIITKFVGQACVGPKQSN